MHLTAKARQMFGDNILRRLQDEVSSIMDQAHADFIVDQEGREIIVHPTEHGSRFSTRLGEPEAVLRALHSMVRWHWHVDPSP